MRNKDKPWFNAIIGFGLIVIDQLLSQILSYLDNNLPPLKNFMLLLFPGFAKSPGFDIIMYICISLLILLILMITAYNIIKPDIPRLLSRQDNIVHVRGIVETIADHLEKTKAFIEQNFPEPKSVVNAEMLLDNFDRRTPIDNTIALLKEFPLPNSRRDARTELLEQNAPLVVEMTRHIVAIVERGNYWNDNYEQMAKDAYMVGRCLQSKEALKATFDLAYMLAQHFHSRFQSSIILQNGRDAFFKGETKFWIKNLKRIIEKLAPDSDVLLEQASWIDNLRWSVKRSIKISQAQRMPDQALVSECEAKWLYMEGLRKRDFEWKKKEEAEALFQKATLKARGINPQVNMVICETAKCLGNLKKDRRMYDEAIDHYQEALNCANHQICNDGERLNSASYPLLKAECYYQMGESQFRSKRYKDASSTFLSLTNYIQSYPTILRAYKIGAYKRFADALREQIEENQRHNVLPAASEVEEGYKHSKDAYEEHTKELTEQPDQDISTKLTRLIIYFADWLLKNQKQPTV